MKQVIVIRLLAGDLATIILSLATLLAAERQWHRYFRLELQDWIGAHA
jgi:hypothetical protein